MVGQVWAEEWVSRMKKKRVLIIVSILVALTIPLTFVVGRVRPFWERQPMLMGANLPSATFAAQTIPGTIDQDYFYPDASDLKYYTGLGMNAIRVGFIWERLQPELDRPLDQSEAERLEAAVRAVLDQYAVAILDLHNFAHYRGQVIGSPAVPLASFADLWARLAVMFRGNERVKFGLMNEPHDIEAEQWQQAAQAAIGAIRHAGARNLILVASAQWDGAAHFVENGDVWKRIDDPAGNLAFEVHQYLDADGSGTQPDCSKAGPALDAIQQVTQWMRGNRRKVFLGEFGVSARPDCLSALSQVLAYIRENPDVWLGWAYFAGGRGWSDDDLLSIAPVGGQEKPQMTVLRTFLQR